MWYNIDDLLLGFISLIEMLVVFCLKLLGIMVIFFFLFNRKGLLVDMFYIWNFIGDGFLSFFINMLYV